MKTTRRFGCGILAGLAFCTALMVVALPIAHAVDIEPLRSADLDAQLKRAGFDDAQRATVLADYSGYVTRFTAVVADRTGDWQSLVRTVPETLEDGRALQSKARAVAQSFDEAERPLIDAIRSAARSDQVAAAQQVIALLAIRRDLVFADTMREGLYSGRSVDVIEAIDALHLSNEIIAVLQPQLTQYLVERQAAVHRLREAILNAPLRRIEARLNYQQPARPLPSSEPAAAGEGEALDSDRMKKWIAEARANEGAMYRASNAERNEARLKSLELDVRTLDAILPRMTPREQVHLLSCWWLGAGSMAYTLGDGPGALNRAWKAPSDRITPSVATQLDAICTAWIGAWWPVAKSAVINNTRDGGQDFFGANPAQENSPKEERAVAATTEAAAAIDLAIDGKPAAETSRAGGSREIAGAIALSGGSFEVMEWLEVDEQMFEVDGGFEASEVSFTAVQADGFMGPSPLPQLMQFEEIQPVLAAAGVDASMMEVAKTAVDDLRAEVNTIVQEAQVIQRQEGELFIGSFARGDGTPVRRIDPAEATRRSAQCDALRARLLALEAAKLTEILTAIVPDSGQACISWLAPWRQYVSAQTATAPGEFFGMVRSPLDPTRAVRAAKLSAQDLCAVGPELAAVCADLAAREHAAAAIRKKVREALPTPIILEDGVTPKSIDASAAEHADLMRLEAEAAKLQKAARAATHESIARLKKRLATGPAQQLQDAWDDQLYARTLKDPTKLTSRFESALAMTLSDPVRAQVVALQSSWTSASRAFRDKIVALKSTVFPHATTPEEVSRITALKAERTVRLKAVSFERDETNRRVFRELCALVGAESSAKLQPLPKGRGTQMGIGAQGASFSFTSSAPAP